jgi:toxin ParE2
MTKYRLTSAALSELREATLYYEREEPGLGRKFLDEVDDTIDRIILFPRAWHPVSARTRRCRTHRFPFGLLYQDDFKKATQRVYHAPDKASFVELPVVAMR